MDEGKPTKGKWWSRPRAQEAPGAPAEDADGDFRLAHPTRPTPDGDYELSRPSAPPAVDEPEAAAGCDEPGPATDRVAPAGDFDGPSTGPSIEPSPAGPSGGGASVDRSATLAEYSEYSEYSEQSGPSGAPPDSAAGSSGVVGIPGSVGAPEPSGRSVTADDASPGSPAGPSGATGGFSGDVGHPGEHSASAPERPRPLHEPDPYNTPPYGEPGPWAPAPPVQHPAVSGRVGHLTGAGTEPGADQAGCSTAAPFGDVPVPAQAPGPAPASAPASASHPASASASHPAPAFPPAPASLPASDSAPGPSPAADPPPAPVPPPGRAPAPGGPDPAPGPDPGPAPAPAPTSAAGAPSPGPAGSAGSPPDPWQGYDPWAAAPAPIAPLQQTGAGVLTEAQQRKRARKRLLGAALALALLSGGVGGIAGTYLERNGGLGSVELPQSGVEAPERPADSVAGIAARALPGVVTLHVVGGDESGTGTGFVLDSRGHILTNNHVVEAAGGGGRITVVFYGGETAEAEIVGRDAGYDLAVVKVDGVTGLKPLPLGNSDSVQVGDPVVAIGAPFDLAGTVTSGIISAKERPITAGGESGDASDVSYVDALQTDAPINPGNSGGPLLDIRGRVIGINSAIRSAGGGSEPGGGQAGSIGLGFAIPVNQGKRVAEELINTGRATHPVIGITLDMDYGGDGARVGTKNGDGSAPVVVGGPGDRAGIEAGDVIVEVDGQPVHSGEELIIKTRAHRPGDRLELTVERDGARRTLSLVLGSSSD
ncbi:trypsin-like peptidase domain-containing protein [Streptomyces sp. bgisy153]|uniref:S1C family serine protease n=1 Tax=Streptomyces sp. bgisy153 TaxID=3413793 RepID=UPI003D710F55